MSVKLISGHYPQIDGMYATLSNRWNENDLKAQGHTLLHLRLREGTLRSKGGSKLYSEMDDDEMSEEMAAIKHAMGRSTQRSSDQIKATMCFDMDWMPCYMVEKAFRAEMVFHGRKAAADAEIVMETMITKCNGRICHWGRVDKGINEGVKMVLVYIDKQHVGRMSKKDRASAMGFTWNTEVCVVSEIDVIRTQKKTVCGHSGAYIKQ